MKFIFNPILLLFLSNFLMAQTVREYVDFFSWNEDIEETNHVRYIYGGDVVIIRHFTKGNNWEIIQTTDSTFSYFQYDSTLIKTHYTATLATAKNVAIDTVVNYHPYTFETYLSYWKTIPLIRNGLWEGKEDNLWLKGNYKNDVKTGEWSVYQMDDDRDYQKWIYEDGKVISKHQLNLVKTLSRDSLEKRLIGNWCSVVGTYGSDRIQFRKIDCFDIYTFNHDTLKYTGANSHGMHNKERKWSLNDKMELIIDNLKYRIVFFLFFEGEEVIELEKIRE